MTNNFTDEELVKIRDFYRNYQAFLQTDVGRKMSEIMSPANKAMLEIGQKHMGKLMALVTMMGAR
jgi:hypothetical protein